MFPKIALAPYRRPVTTEPMGQGRPVLVVPGMASGDRSTAFLRSSLAAAGYKPYAAGLGRNLTISAVKFMALETLLSDIVDRSDQRAILLGWSLGGFYARVLAPRHPEKVAMVLTLGTPFSGDRRGNNAWRLYELFADHTVDHPPIHDDPATKPEAYTVAMWSPVDGVVSPRSARGEATERDEEVEFPFRHFEMGCSRPAVRRIVELVNERIGKLH